MEPLDYLQVPGWRLWRSWWGWGPTLQPSTNPRWVAPTFRQIRSGRVRRNPARRLWSCPRNQGLFGSNISGQTDYSTGKFDVYVYKEVRKQKVHLLFFYNSPIADECLTQFLQHQKLTKTFHFSLFFSFSLWGFKGSWIDCAVRYCLHCLAESVLMDG